MVNLESQRKASKKHYWKDVESHRKIAALKQRRYRRKLRRKALDILGGICVKCGCTDWRALQIDHIYGGGNKEIRSMSRPAYHRKIILTPDKSKYQILCANCNKIKSYKNKEWAGYKYAEES